jgi:uncharacterized protein
VNLARLVLVAGAVALAVAFGGVGRPDAARSASEPPERSITVSGTGAITVVPDRAVFSFGVQSRGRTASDAMTANAAAMRRVIAALKTAGISDRDIQTRQVSLSPLYSDDARETLVGYSASNSVSVVVRRLGDAGSLIDRAVSAGANEVEGPSLDRANHQELYREALEAALADAQAKGQTIAAASGLTLGRPTLVQETGAAPPVPYEARAADAPPVEPGSQELTASVTVTFAAS